MELARRLILIICIAAGIGTAYLACLDPVVIVKLYERKARALVPMSPVSDLSREAIPAEPLLLPRDVNAFVAKKQPRILEVEGDEWTQFFERVYATIEGKKEGTPWSGRFPSGAHPMKVLFFRPYESPLDRLSFSSPGKAERFVLRRDDGGRPQYLEVDYRSYSDNDFRLGSGFSSYPKPPLVFLYPYRLAGLILVLIGVGFYLLLPWHVVHPGALRYDRWRIVVSDVLGAILFAFPVVVAVLVKGGTLQVFPDGFFVFLLFSPFFLGGLAVLWVSAWYGTYEILRTGEGLKIITPGKMRFFPYREMTFFQPVVFKPPRWLVILSWVAVLISAGTARLGAAGRAFMLSSSFTGSIAIGLRNGATVFITVTDQMGSTSLKGFDGILETLRRNGVGERRDVKTIRSLGLEILRLPGEGQ
ncbi:MAG TPA: hypothetical protein VGJ94_01955 [Syntrophorhabdaceae bacterium]